MTKEAFEKKFWELWFQGQTEKEKKIKWLPSKRPAQVVEEYLEYLWIVSNIKHPWVLEIGVKEGHQRRFYEGLLDCGMYEGIDTNPETPATILGSSQNTSMITYMSKKSPGGWDIIFVDGNHTREGVRADYETYKGMVRSGGWLVLHDIHHDHWKGSDGAAVLWKEIQDAHIWGVDIYHEADYLPMAHGQNVRKQAGIGVLHIP